MLKVYKVWENVQKYMESAATLHNTFYLSISDCIQDFATEICLNGF